MDIGAIKIRPGVKPKLASQNFTPSANVAEPEQNLLGKVRITQTNKSVMISQNFRPKPNVALAELVDVIGSAEDGDSVVFNADTGKYEIKPPVTTIVGGSF